MKGFLPCHASRRSGETPILSSSAECWEPTPTPRLRHPVPDFRIPQTVTRGVSGSRVQDDAGGGGGRGGGN